MEIYERANDSAALEKIFVNLDDLIQAIREDHFSDEGRFFEQERLSRFYKKAFAFYNDKGDDIKAYYYMQRMKNIILLEKLHFKGVNQNFPLEYKEEYTLLKDSIQRIVQENAKDNELEAVKMSFFRLQNKIKEEYPDYHRQRFATPDISVEDIQREIGDEQVVLDYFLDSSSLHLFALTNRTIIHHKREIDPHFYDELSFIIEAVRKRPKILDFDESQKMALNAQLMELYETLIEPYIDEAKSLVIIGHEQLFFLPFEALVSNPKNKDCPYLICHKSISYSFSAPLWLLSKQKKSFDEKFAFIYSPYEDPTNEKGYLKYAVKETEAVQEALETEKFTNLSKSEFLEKCTISNIHHFLTHTFVDNRSPIKSYLSLGKDVEPVFIHDIINQQIDSEMVCLSACETGVGSLAKAEGVISLARAFLEAGANSIVMSSSKISDKTSSDIMVSYYEFLQKGFSKSESMAYAKREYLATSSKFNSHPYFWSGFTVQGNEAAIFQRSRKDLIMNSIALIFISIFGVFAFRKMKRIAVA